MDDLKEVVFAIRESHVDASIFQQDLRQCRHIWMTEFAVELDDRSEHASASRRCEQAHHNLATSTLRYAGIDWAVRIALLVRLELLDSVQLVVICLQACFVDSSIRSRSQKAQDVVLLQHRLASCISS